MTAGAYRVTADAQPCDHTCHVTTTCMSCDQTLASPSDCPQVQAIYDYHSEQPDELSLERGDIVKVLRKMADGT